MPPVGFETTIPVFERAKTVHALDRAATVIGTVCFTLVSKLSCVVISWRHTQPIACVRVRTRLSISVTTVSAVTVICC
jgi:hypothetical protein